MTLTRDFTVAVFVVHQGKVVLHLHQKLGLWLPPGGHIEPNELPDEAAIREVAEEAGIAIELMGERGMGTNYPGQPKQLIRPEGIQLEHIKDDHQHIDLIYFARPTSTPDLTFPNLLDGMRWIAPDQLGDLPVTEEVRDWMARAIAVAARW